MKRILFVLGLLAFVPALSVFSQEAEDSRSAQENQAGSESGDAFAIIPELEAEESSDIASGRTRAVFKTNVRSAAIYLNGNLQGRSQLTLNNLIEGYYLLRVEKDGYNFKENFIYVENAKSKSFYIELEPNEDTKKREQARAGASPRQGEDAGSAAETSDAGAAENLSEDAGTNAGIGGVDAR